MLNKTNTQIFTHSKQKSEKVSKSNSNYFVGKLCNSDRRELAQGLNVLVFIYRAGETGQQLRAPSVLEDPASIPSTHKTDPKTSVTSIPGGIYCPLLAAFGTAYM